MTVAQDVTVKNNTLTYNVFENSDREKKNIEDTIREWCEINKNPIRIMFV